LFAFYTIINNRASSVTRWLLTFSEFGRRISENGSSAPTTAQRRVMMAMGGRVNGGLYGTTPNLILDPSNPNARESSG
jgi:uncharacterized protein (DUF1501 family)